MNRLILAAFFVLALAGGASAQTKPMAINPAQCNVPAACADMANQVQPYVNGVAGHIVFGLTATAGTGTGTSEQTLATFPLAPGALDVAGRHLRITADFARAANTDSVTPKLYFGSEALATAANTTSGSAMKIQCDVIKTGASTQQVNCWGLGGAAGVTPVIYSAAGAETDTSAITIKATCTDGTSAANDCTLSDMFVEFLN
jgi:hypothetical protein